MKKVKALIMTALLTVGGTSVAGAASAGGMYCKEPCEEVTVTKPCIIEGPCLKEN